jgi:hypothetical protein
VTRFHNGRPAATALALVDNLASERTPDRDQASDSHPQRLGTPTMSRRPHHVCHLREQGMTDTPNRRPTTAAPRPESPTVVLGSRVRVRDADGEHEYTMCTRVTADAPPGRVSLDSPVGRALLGRRRGEEVRVQTPGGIRLLTVVDVAATTAPSSAGSAGWCEA